MVAYDWNKLLDSRWDQLNERYPKVVTEKTNTVRHLGTLGTGNHFIEICLDESDQVWIMLHSGSRGIGNRIGSFFIELAKKDMEKWFITLPDKNLAYFPQGSEHFERYVEAVQWAQDYAFINRQIMMEDTLHSIGNILGRDIAITETAVNCHHNYIDIENHFGSNVIVTRKGAIRARKGDLGIIPGSMGAKSFIVRGKGNKESFCSCSHGAGRKLGRKEAKRMYTAQDLADQTQGIECPKDDERVDEIPAAYKSIDKVMENQSDLVEIVHTLKQVINIKG
jgi:tRNA-splicing ligase RtcB